MTKELEQSEAKGRARAEEIVLVFDSNTAGIVKNAHCLVAFIDEDPRGWEYLKESRPNWSAQKWAFLEDLGRDAHWTGVLDVPHSARLLPLPASEQRRIIEIGVPVVLSNGEVANLKYADLTGRQKSQLLKKSVIRDENAQIIWLREHSRPVRLAQKNGEEYSYDEKTDLFELHGAMHPKDIMRLLMGFIK